VSTAVSAVRRPAWTGGGGGGRIADAVGRAGKVEQVGAFGVVELQRAADRVEHG